MDPVSDEQLPRLRDSPWFVCPGACAQSHLRPRGVMASSVHNRREGSVRGRL